MAFGFVAPDIGIDLGTCNVRVFVKGKGIVLSEPTLLVVSNDAQREVLAVGEDARIMLGRTTQEIMTVLPVNEGVIADFDMTEIMLRYFVRRAIGAYHLTRPRVAITVPCGLSPVERRAVDEAMRAAGARAVFVVEQPFAAAIGTGLPVYDPVGSLVVDMGGGVTEVALISMGGTVASRSIRVAGNKMNDSIVNTLKQLFGILVSDRTAEDLKLDLGSAVQPGEQRVMVRGRDVVTGLPMTVEITALQVYEALREPLGQILEALRWVLERTPPELAADVLRNGIHLTGGAAQLPGLDTYLASELGIPVMLAKESADAVALGVGYLAENLELLARIGQGEPLAD